MYLPENTLLHGGTYRIIRFISSGGFGCTYEAEHIMLGKRVAIKEFFVKDFCNRDENTAHVTLGTLSKKALVDKLRKKFLDEAKGLSKLRHPGIVSVSDVFEENGTAYFVMDYVDGKSLNDMVKEEGFLSEERAVGYIKRVSDALRYVHENNRLHLDLKPGNIMVDSNDNPILIDFGASKQYDEESGENTSTLMGKTPGYAPIEQMSNTVVKFLPATDIYALGATLYKLVTGMTPVDATMLASGEELEPLPATISEPTRKAIMAAMQTNKSRRPQTIDEFLSLLNGTSHTATARPKPTPKPVITPKPQVVDEDEATVVGAKPVATPPRPEKPSEPEPKPKKKRSLLPIFIAAGVIIGVIIGFFALRDTKSGDDNSVAVTAPSANIASEYNKDGIEMVYVAGGTFMMGASSNDSEAWDWEKPAHSVTLSSFYIGKYEVTQKQWVEIMGSNPSNWEGDNLPVDNVNWNDVQEFIKKLNARTGKNYRLPTEAEWEFAARGGNNSRGYKYSGSNNIDAVAWYESTSGDKTHPVGSKSPNELGIYDMIGNVWEWCADWYDENYYSNSPTTNPKGPNSGSYRVMRGGSWGDDARYCRVSDRSYDSPGGKYGLCGFRLAMDAERSNVEMSKPTQTPPAQQKEDPKKNEAPQPPKEEPKPAPGSAPGSASTNGVIDAVRAKSEVPKPAEQTPKPAEQPVAREPDVEAMAEVEVIRINENFENMIFFNEGSTKVMGNERAKIDDLVTFLKANPNTTITITGYTDTRTGSADYNERLSIERARSVASLLMSKGIASDRITVRAGGHSIFVDERNNCVVCLCKF